MLLDNEQDEVEREVETSMISVISRLEALLNAQFGLKLKNSPTFSLAQESALASGTNMELQMSSVQLFQQAKHVIRQIYGGTSKGWESQSLLL